MENIDIESVKRFHGHWCPGLALGIRVAQAALDEIGPHSGDEEIVAMVETDNCAVDAIQFLTGCTFGKGNLIHLDYGKNAFTFLRRSDGKAIRVLVKPRAWEPVDPELKELREKEQLTQDQEERLRQARIQDILERPTHELVEIQSVSPDIPAEARVFRSVTCAGCHEQVMETRARLFRSEIYCPPCFQQRNQRF